MHRIPIYLLSIAIVTLLIYYMKPITYWMESLFVSPSKKTPVVATVVAINGQATAYRSFHTDSLKKGSHIYNYDRVEVGPQSLVTLSFPSGYHIEFSENSQFLVELWNQEKSQSPAYIYFEYGQHKMIQKGKSTGLYIIKNNKQYTPKQIIPPQTPLEVTSLTTSFPTLPPLSEKTHTTLSTEHIESKVREKRSQFEECLLNSLRKDQNVSGHISVGFSILANGKTTNVKAVQSDLTSGTLKACVLGIFKRLQFDSFKEDRPIDFTYPLDFK